MSEDVRSWVKSRMRAKTNSTASASQILPHQMVNPLQSPRAPRNTSATLAATTTPTANISSLKTTRTATSDCGAGRLNADARSARPPIAANTASADDGRVRGRRAIAAGSTLMAVERDSTGHPSARRAQDGIEAHDGSRAH